MAQQNYKKFVATAATATLVASALVPVASANVTTSAFTDVGSSYKEAVDFLVTNNISKGYSETQYGVQMQIKRGDAAVMIANAAGLNDKDAVSSGFSDVPTRAALAVNSLKAAKVVNGKTDTKFGFEDNLTRGEAAIMLQRAFNLKAGDVKNEFTDVKDSYDAAVDALVANKVTKGINATQFGTGNNIKRGDFAKFLFALKDQIVIGNAVEEVTVVNDTTTTAKLKEANKDLTAADFKVLVNGEAVTPEKVESDAKGEVYTITHPSLKGSKGVVSVNGKQADFDFVTGVQVESVKATNAKTVTVTFDKAVVDPTKAEIELLRGNFKQNVTLNWAADNKSVELVAANNLQAADYTVNVKGLSDSVMTGTVTIEAQKVSSIEILDEIAVVSEAAGVDGKFVAGTTATVGYVVKDQYGVDITDKTQLTTNDETNITASKGLVTIKAPLVAGKKADDIVPVVLIDAKTGKSTTQVVKLSAASMVSDIAVAGIYNAKGEVVELNDMSTAADAFVVLDLKDQYGKEITKKSQATGLVVTNTNESNLTVTSEVSEQKIGDATKLVVKISAIKKAGNTDLLLISTTNGKSTKYTVKVAETATTDTITVSQPEISVAGEDTLIPLTVLDKEGNVITDTKLLTDANKGVKVGSVLLQPSDLVVKDGQVFYKTKLTEGKQPLVFQSSTYKVAAITVDVKAPAVATTVRGAKAPIVLSTKKDPVEIKAADHLVIEDQYGRAIEKSAAPITVTLVGESDVVSVSGNTVTPLKNGKATLKVALTTENGTVDSAVEIPVQVTDGTEYSGYEIAPIGKTQVETAKAFTVNGLLNNGKVELESGEYTATLSGGNIEGARAVTSPITVTTAELDKKNATDVKGIDTEFTLKVTINATGKVMEQKFVVSPDEATTADFFFTDTATTGNYSDAVAITTAKLDSGATVASASLKAGAKNVNIATVDQYGNEDVVALDPTTVTIVPEKASEVTIAGNGTKNAKATLNGVTEAKVTLKIKVGNATKELKATVISE